jgi:hypothetical protein
MYCMFQQYSASSDQRCGAKVKLVAVEVCVAGCGMARFPAGQQSASSVPSLAPVP